MQLSTISIKVTLQEPALATTIIDSNEREVKQQVFDKICEFVEFVDTCGGDAEEFTFY